AVRGIEAVEESCPRLRRRNLFARLGFPVLAVFIGTTLCLLGLMQRGPKDVLLVALLFFWSISLLWYVMTPWLHRLNHKDGFKRSHRLAKRGSVPDLFAPQTIQLTSEAIEIDQNGITNRHLWSSLHHVEERPEQLLAFLSDSTALVIPKR